MATLRAWLEAQGDPAQAGERLGVHENTVRYRLRKMAEITNLALDDARKRLAMISNSRPPTTSKRFALSKHDKTLRRHCLAPASPPAAIHTTMEIADQTFRRGSR